MLATTTFFGKRLDMQHYKNVVMNRTIEILDENGDIYDLGSEDVYYELFAKAHGKSLDVFNLGDQTSNLVVLDNLVVDHRPSIYYHECYQLIGSPSDKVLLFYGVSEII